MEGKVLVTGASGVIGRELCKQLFSQGLYVAAIDSGFRYTEIPQCNEYHKVDIINYVSTVKNNFDYIFHMGNVNGTKYFYEQPNTLVQNNISADFAIFNFVKQNKNCKLIYASSSEVVAGTNSFPTGEETDITIKDIHNPRWSYRLGKIVGENYLANSDLNYTIVRFFNIYSENSGSGHFVKDITDKCKQGNYDLIGAYETRSFCYVEDAVDAVIQIKDVSREIINIGSDEEITVLEAANIVAQSLGLDNVAWNFKNSIKGSVKRRKPDITTLKSYYPEFDPKSFASIISKIKLV